MDPPPSQSRLFFRKTQKLRRPVDFEEVFNGKQKAGDDVMLVFGRRNGTGTTRLGLSVSRKHGGAVQRGRIKRLLREAFRLHQHEVPAGLDLVVIPRVGGTADVPTFARSLIRLARKLANRLPPAPEPPPT